MTKIKHYFIPFFLLLALISITCAQEARGPFGPKPLEAGRAVTEVTTGSLFNVIIRSPIIWLLVLGAIFWIKEYKKGKTNKYFRYFGVMLILGFIVSFTIVVPLAAETKEGIEVVPADRSWKENYQMELPADMTQYLNPTDYYDINNPSIKNIANSILASAKNEYEAIQTVLDYVYTTVEYDYYESDSTCFNAIGSEVLERGTGQCDTQSIAVITLLRSMGIAARPVGGCLSADPACELQSMLFVIPDIRRPKWTELDTIDPTAEYYGRTAAISRAPSVARAGGLHLWVEAYSVTRDKWLTIESTSGEIMDKMSCYRYDVELYPDDTQKDLLCVSYDAEFALFCAQR